MNNLSSTLVKFGVNKEKCQQKLASKTTCSNIRRFNFFNELFFLPYFGNCSKV